MSLQSIAPAISGLHVQKPAPEGTSSSFLAHTSAWAFCLKAGGSVNRLHGLSSAPLHSIENYKPPVALADGTYSLIQRFLCMNGMVVWAEPCFFFFFSMNTRCLRACPYWCIVLIHCKKHVLPWVTAKAQQRVLHCVKKSMACNIFGALQLIRNNLAP